MRLLECIKTSPSSCLAMSPTEVHPPMLSADLEFSQCLSNSGNWDKKRKAALSLSLGSLCLNVMPFLPFREK